MKNVTVYYLFIVLSLLFYSCGSDKSKAGETLTHSSKKLDNNDLDEVPYELPSTLEIAELFNNAGLSYIGSLTSDTKNVNKFNSPYSQKINFGIYSADMTYCIMNNQTQESVNYLNTLRKLSEKLWMTDVFNTLGLRSRLEQNASEDDSLKYIMSDLQIQLDEYLDENGMGYTGSVIFAGAWIETMYLGTSAVASKKNEQLINQLLEQSTTLKTLIKAIKQVDRDNDYVELIADLENLNIFFSPSSENNETSSTMLNEEKLDRLTSAIANLRSKIIEESL